MPPASSSGVISMAGLISRTGPLSVRSSESSSKPGRIKAFPYLGHDGQQSPLTHLKLSRESMNAIVAASRDYKIHNGNNSTSWKKDCGTFKHSTYSFQFYGTTPRSRIVEPTFDQSAQQHCRPSRILFCTSVSRDRVIDSCHRFIEKFNQTSLVR